MKPWQKYWLSLVIIFSVLHIVRDIFQDLGTKNWLSTVLVKSHPSLFAPLFRSVFNTYLLAFLEISLAVVSLRRNRFGKIGYSTIFIGVVLLFAWWFYYFIL